MKITFQAKIPQEPQQKYKTQQARENTVAVLGSSKTVDEILNYMDMCSNSTKALVLNGKNLVHGCCTMGIMGAAYDSGLKYSRKDANNKPQQNLAIITKPLWGDEDLEHCIPIACASSEADRIEKFTKVADTILIFPGSVGTMQEITTLISKNYYGNLQDRKRIILVGSDFFKGLIEQYNKLYEAGLIKCPPENLFTVVDSEDEINKIILY